MLHTHFIVWTCSIYLVSRYIEKPSQISNLYHNFTRLREIADELMDIQDNLDRHSPAVYTFQDKDKDKGKD